MSCNSGGGNSGSSSNSSSMTSARQHGRKLQENKTRKTADTFVLFVNNISAHTHTHKRSGGEKNATIKIMTLEPFASVHHYYRCCYRAEMLHFLLPFRYRKKSTVDITYDTTTTMTTMSIIDAVVVIVVIRPKKISNVSEQDRE